MQPLRCGVTEAWEYMMNPVIEYFSNDADDSGLSHCSLTADHPLLHYCVNYLTWNQIPFGIQVFCFRVLRFGCYIPHHLGSSFHPRPPSELMAPEKPTTIAVDRKISVPVLTDYTRVRRSRVPLCKRFDFPSIAIDRSTPLFKEGLRLLLRYRWTAC